MSEIKVQIEAQGNRFKMALCGGHRVGGGDRGKITKFSRSSRKRFFDSVTSLKTEKVLFTTLTYKELPTLRQAKRDLHVFIKRLIRRYPECSGHWRLGLESQGERKGYNPHFHVLIYGLKWIPHHWLEQTWKEVTGEGGFVWLELKGWRQVIAYVGRYLASLEHITYLTEGDQVGRYWGAFNRSKLPLDVLVSLAFGLGAWFWKVKRCGRRRWRGVNDRRYCGFTLYCDNPCQWVRLCCRMAVI